MKLNAGCGGGTYDFRDLGCNVNLDIEKPRIKIENFVQADIHHLPFRNKSFNIVFCYHVLEHVNNPLLSLYELVRVCKNIVIVRVPHRLSRDARRDPKHKHFFSTTYFTVLLFILSKHVNVAYEVFTTFKTMFKIPFIRMPSEIVAIILKH